MATTVRVKVLRSQLGEKRFAKGDYRTLEVADAERLASTGAVEIVSKPARAAPKRQAPKKRGAKPAAKAAAVKKAAAPKNKKAAAPANKARA